MQRIPIVVCLLSVASAWQIRAAETSSDTLLWVGLDYSKVKMIGTADFRQPEKIFPGYLIEWNSLFMKELLPKLEKMAPGLKTDLKSVQAHNGKARASQIIREDGTRAEMVTPSDITEKVIAQMVRSYDLKDNHGMGLVFVMDRLVKSQETGCLYVVFFDLASRKVLLSERLCEEAGGAGFRNYWFKPIKKTVEKLPAIYTKAKSLSKN